MSAELEKRVRDLEVDVASLRRRLRLADTAARDALATARQARDLAQEVADDAAEALDST